MNTRYDLNMEVPPREAVRLLYISKSRFGGDWRSVPHTHACTDQKFPVNTKAPDRPAAAGSSTSRASCSMWRRTTSSSSTPACSIPS